MRNWCYVPLCFSGELLSTVYTTFKNFPISTHVPRVSANKAYKTNCLQEFPILLALNYYTFMCTCNFNKYEHIYTYRNKEFQTILESKKIMRLVWTVVTGLILNMKLNMILTLLMEFACIRHSWTLQQINLTVCHCVILYRFSWTVYGEANCLLSLGDSSQNTGKHWNKVRYQL